jgi:ubiquinone/menaquinone biosynthesis C-methylase UbiE
MFQKRHFVWLISTSRSFLQANVYELPFEDNSYDIVTGWGLILYLSDPLKAIKEMLRVLKPGGIMAFVSADWGAFLYHPEPPGVVAAFRYFEKLQVGIAASEPFD